MMFSSFENFPILEVIFAEVIKMPDWNKINKRKRKEINLGMAKNGAIHILKDVKNPHWSKLYKETVRLLFLFNEELDKELLEGKIDETMLAGEIEVIA